jgi:ATP synthase protein I
VNTPDQSPETTENSVEESAGLLPAEPDPSMQEYYVLQEFLLKVTLICTGIIFISVWAVYGLSIALNYLLGAIAGVVYLRLLARNVEQLGRQKSQIGKTQIAIFIGVMIFASQWHQLQVLPVFLGFLTYKAAILVYMFKSLDSSNAS